MFAQPTIFVWLILCLFSTTLYAQQVTKTSDEAKAAHKISASSSVMRISYASSSWNLDPKKIDTAFIIVRDRDSGRLVQIQLEETEPDSSQFTGQFSIRVNDQEKFQPEVYVPPMDMRNSDNDHRKLLDMIQQGKLPRKPLIWKRNERGQAVLDVYDTREQAEAGLKAYQEEQKLAQELRKKKPLKGMSGDTALGAAQAAERKAQFDKLALDASKRAEERLRMEQIEKQKATEREAREKQLTEEQKAERRAKAAKLNLEGFAFFNKGDFPNAEAKFKEAVDLDSENKSYFYMYGITLYRNQKFNDALVVLKLSTVEPKQEVEKKYYMALVHYRLSELDSALSAFVEVSKSEDKNLGPSSLFYAGIIQFSQEKYEASKKSFEGVIDTSSDPHLDEQAEEYLDKIAGAMAYQKMRENKWTLMGMIGIMYDSNVLLSPANNQGTGTPTNSPDVRLLTLADIQYRPIYNEKYELAPHATFNLTNSEKAQSASADPWLFDLGVPFTYKSMLGKKAWRMTWTPGYEMLYMDPNKTGTKQQELSSLMLTLDNTIFMSQDWISTYSLQYRADTSYDPSSVGPNDLNATMYTVRTTQMTFIDKARKQALIPMLDYIRNSAVGDQKSYNRYDLGITYLRPINKMTWNIGLTYYNMTFPGTSLPQRVDKDYALSTGISLPVREWITWGVTGTYTKNDSTDVASAYNKYMIMTTATFITNF